MEDESDLTKWATSALLDELRDRAAETNLTDMASDEDLIAECRRRGFPPYDADVDGVLLKEADFGEIIAQLEENGDGETITDPDDAEQLAELIAEQRTSEALDLLKRMAPGIIHPSTIKRLVADRAAEGLKAMLS